MHYLYSKEGVLKRITSLEYGYISNYSFLCHMFHNIFVPKNVKNIACISLKLSCFNELLYKTLNMHCLYSKEGVFKRIHSLEQDCISNYSDLCHIFHNICVTPKCQKASIFHYNSAVSMNYSIKL